MDDSGRGWEFEAELWRWQSNGGTAWIFVTLPQDVADEIDDAAPEPRAGFGSIKVDVAIGEVRWQTSLFPSTEHESFILPLKAPVRRKAGVDVGDSARFALSLADV